MFDPSLSPSASRFLVTLNCEQHCAIETSAWAKSNLRDRWNSSGLLASSLFDRFYFWFMDELDFDVFRKRFGGHGVDLA